jgi:hypothetical protein
LISSSNRDPGQDHEKETAVAGSGRRLVYDAVIRDDDDDVSLLHAMH